ncbi:MAG TPA: protein-glutamate O-methyltransferase CheR [Ohtaekwangia sp.]|nr:protein-glutamate O-methyltransferase CheR [Ohtaekwangia sp.]
MKQLNTLKNMIEVMTVAQSGKLSMDDFLQVSAFIEEHYGIQLPITKLKMVEARLQKRLKALNVNSFTTYFDYVFSESGFAEYKNMIDLITTNKTDFFRETAHFEFLTQEVFPEILKRKAADDPIRIWSAASSSGEEVYSTLITLEEFFLKTFKKHPYKILGTDLSEQVLKQAVTAVYDEDRIEALPLHLKKRYFQRNKNKDNALARIKPDYLKHVEFKRLNLLKAFVGIEHNYDIIFCRNVLIYFNRVVQETVITKLVAHLSPGGYLLIGHAESITNMKLPLAQVRPTMYKKL